DPGGSNFAWVHGRQPDRGPAGGAGGRAVHAGELLPLSLLHAARPDSAGAGRGAAGPEGRGVRPTDTPVIATLAAENARLAGASARWARSPSEPGTTTGDGAGPRADPAAPGPLRRQPATAGNDGQVRGGAE